MKRDPDDDNDWEELANDPTRKAKSNDPGWKYAFWPNVNNKDLIKCALCGNENHGGIYRFKQHLIGGFPDVHKCPKTTGDITNVMSEFMASKKRQNSSGKKRLKMVCVPLDQDYEEEEQDQEIESATASNDNSLSGTMAKKKMTLEFHKVEQKASKTIDSFFKRTPVEVVEDRYTEGPSQTNLGKNRLRTPEDEDRVHMHIANFFYECGIPLNIANSMSFEVMVESIGQYGPGLKPPTDHELREPLLEKAKEETEKLREKHKKAWKIYGCTLMSDGWTNRQGKHLINFFANSPEGNFFLSSVNASSVSHDPAMLANLLDIKINEIGEKNVVQVVTDNGANYEAAGEILESRIPTLFWTPCAAKCIDLMLEDIGKLSGFKKTINQAKRCTTFIFRHGRILDALRENTNGRDIVRAGATRFVTSFMTLQSMYKNREPLRYLFCAEDWARSKLSKTENGKKVCDTVLSTLFWDSVKECIQASQPLLAVLRIVDGDENSALAEIAYSMDCAKNKIKASFDKKRALLNKIVKIIEDRWEKQIGKPLYGAALFLNPRRYFDVLENDISYASRLREDFNVVLEKMVTDPATRNRISNFADEYKNATGAFAREMAIEQRKEKDPFNWWGAYGGRAFELQSLTMRIVGLCCTSSGCERNWSEFIHSKKRSRLEHQHLNDLVYVQYNRKIDSRFKKRRALGKKIDPLALEDFEWNNEWISNEEDTFSNAVDVAEGASHELEGCNLPTRSQGDSTCGIVYTRRNKSSRIVDEDSDEEVIPLDDEEVEDDYGAPLLELANVNVEGDRQDIELDDYA